MIPPTLVRQGNRDPLSAEVEHALRQAILAGYLKPGDRIIEGDIADQLHVSRGPVREALSNLEHDGLVFRKRHYGTFVKTLSHRDTREIYTMLALLEGEAAAYAVGRITDQDLLALDGLIESFSQTLNTTDIRFMFETDRAFHGIVIRSADHSLLQQTCKKLDELMAACFLTITTTIPDRTLSIVDRHQRLIDALRKGDAENARRQFSDHYLDSLLEMSKTWQDHNTGTQDTGIQGADTKDKPRVG